MIFFNDMQLPAQVFFLFLPYYCLSMFFPYLGNLQLQIRSILFPPVLLNTENNAYIAMPRDYFKQD